MARQGAVRLGQQHSGRKRCPASLHTCAFPYPLGGVKVELPAGRTTLTPPWGYGTSAARPNPRPERPSGGNCAWNRDHTARIAVTPKGQNATHGHAGGGGGGRMLSYS